MTVLVADRMLEGLARRLRLLGYNCELLSGNFRNRHAMVEKIKSEGKVLLTTAHGLAEMAPEDVVHVQLGALGAQVKAVVQKFPIDFRRQAFTRCSRDNAVLEEIPFVQVENELPPLVREQKPDPIKRCPACGRLYWPGTHTQRLSRHFRKLVNMRLEA